MDKFIDICDGYRLRRFDACNWQLQEWREPAPSRGARKASDSSARWFDTSHYFQKLGQALAFVYERRLREEGEPEESLRDAMERAEAIRDELMGVVA